MLVKINDAVELNYCVKGIKEFFNRHNMDFRKFVKEGIDEEEFIKTGDAMALKLVEHARSKQGK